VTDAKEIAQWMSEEFDRLHGLRQKHAVREIELRFGAEHVIRGKSGSRKIVRSVLREFKSLRPDLKGSGGGWCKETPYFAPGRQKRQLTEAEFKAKQAEKTVHPAKDVPRSGISD
jgi:hypothetical protein